MMAFIKDNTPLAFAIAGLSITDIQAIAGIIAFTISAVVGIIGLIFKIKDAFADKKIDDKEKQDILNSVNEIAQDTNQIVNNIKNIGDKNDN